MDGFSAAVGGGGRPASGFGIVAHVKKSCALHERLRKAIDLLARIVHGKRGAAGRGDAEARQQRHDAMGAGAHRDAGAVDDRRHVVRMRALHLERDDRTLVLGGAEDAQRIDLAQPVVRIVHQPGFVGADARLADRRDIIDRGAEPDRLHDRRRAGLEFVRRLAVGDAVLEHLADHLAAAVERRHGGKMLVFAVEHADPGRAVKLVAGEGVKIAIDVAHVDVEMHRRLRAVEQHRNAARMRDAASTSFAGTSVPSMFDIWVMATSLVRGVSSFSNSSMRKWPSSSTGAHLITAPWRSRRKCHGTMLEWCSMIESTISSPGLDALAPERVGDEIDRLGRVAGEDDLFLAPGVEKGRDLLARALVGFGRLVGEIMQAAMHVGVLRRVGLLQAIEHGARLLRRGGVVEIDERLAVDLHRQDRKIRADAVDVIGAVGDRFMIMSRHARALSQAATDSINASRKPACSMPSIASPRKAWISSASASAAGMPRAIR